MINTIVFSYNRPSQLYLLLGSLERNSDHIFNLNIIYKFDRKSFEEGYEIVKNRFRGVNFVRQSDNFKNDVISILDNKNFEFSTFFVDDNILFEKLEFKEDIIKHLKNDDDVFCFSLRLGKNIKKCYTLKCDNVLVNEEKLEGGKFIRWDWTKHWADFGYPLSVDGHVFHTKEILKMITHVTFDTPNTMEGNLQIFDTYPKQYMVSFSESKLVNNVINIVNNSHPNRHGETINIPVKELNDKFLEGDIIDYDAFDFSKIDGCHCELPVNFKKT